MATALSSLRDRQELMCNIPTGDAYIDSANQLDDIQQAYIQTAYKYDWPDLLIRLVTVPVDENDRYALPSNFRKFRFIFSEGVLVKEVEFDLLDSGWRNYGVDWDANDFVLSEVNTQSTTAYTLSNAETAGSSVVIELNSVSGLSAGDLIWVNGTTTDEFTRIQSVDSDNTTITARLKNNQSAGDVLYRLSDVIYYGYYRLVNALSAAGDVTLLPDHVDYAMLEYAAYLYFQRNQMFERASVHLKAWQERVSEIWLAMDKSSTGATTEFTV